MNDAREPPTPSTSGGVTYVSPPRLSAFPVQREQLENSSRSMVFPSDGDRILRVWGSPDRPFVIGVAESGARWEVRYWRTTPVRAREAVRALFSFAHPLEVFYRLVRREPVLRGSERRFRGLRLPRDASLYEALVHSVLGQQLSVSAAATIKRRVIDATASYAEVDGFAIPYVPPPSALRSLGAEGLARCGTSRAKARALLHLAEREAAGGFDLRWFRQSSREEALRRLDDEPGVGRWTAENALLRGLGRPDIFVAGDLGLRAALSAYGGVRRSASEEVARAWGDRWYPDWGSYATLYLWRKWVAEGTPSG